MAKLTKKYRLPSGETSRSAAPDVEALIITTPTGDTIEVSIDDFPQEILTCAMWHGLSQKIGDAASGKSGQDATEALLDTIEALKGGEWVKERQSAGPRVGDVAVALVRLGKFESEAEAAEYLSGLKESDPDKLKAIRGHSAVKAAVAAIRAERAAAKAESSGELEL